MPGERAEKDLVEQLEQELRRALAIEPSPDFARQVRARIERAPRSTPWRFALAAAAVCVAAVGLGWMMTRNPSDVRITPPFAQVGGDVVLKSEASRPSGDVPPSSRASRSRPAPRVSPSAPEAEIIVPTDRALALARFLELARAGVVNEETLQPIAAAPQPVNLDIELLVVTPIPVPQIEVQSGAAPSGVERE